MPQYFRNTNSHGVSVGDTGRKRAGSVFTASDEEAEQYRGLPGVEEASESDLQEYREERAANNPTSNRTGQMETLDRVGEMAAEARILTVSAPLQRVIGDDLAPFGPPTGEVTTKLEQSEKSLADKLAFAPNEADKEVDEPEDPLTYSTRPKMPLVHNEQYRRTVQADDVAKELNERAGDVPSEETQQEDKPSRRARQPKAQPEQPKQEQSE